VQITPGLLAIADSSFYLTVCYRFADTNIHGETLKSS
jgi:hypothetical protein